MPRARAGQDGHAVVSQDGGDRPSDRQAPFRRFTRSDHGDCGVVAPKLAGSKQHRRGLVDSTQPGGVVVVEDRQERVSLTVPELDVCGSLNEGLLGRPTQEGRVNVPLPDRHRTTDLHHLGGDLGPGQLVRSDPQQSDKRGTIPV